MSLLVLSWQTEQCLWEEPSVVLLLAHAGRNKNIDFKLKVNQYANKCARSE